ncbi:MAG: methylated-DNA--[protein]-cysteine S-methyltransferase [Thermodesulfovibrionales bacterium]|nr:methylated-DNA--[protein]-cysteine S-methyltransferase [Thermodesulfovibrionales bacterium]
MLSSIGYETFVFESPIGLIYCTFEGGFLIELTLSKGEKKSENFKINTKKITLSPRLKRMEREYPLFLHELSQYFKGKLESFRQPIKIKIGSSFDHKVWAALKEIPYGETITYKDLASRIGSPKAFRAVGNSLHRNPLPIVLPCHRVIASNGNLGGYSAGIEIKRWLLKHERSFL